MFHLAKQTLVFLILVGAAFLGAGHGVEECNQEIHETEVELVVSRGSESILERKHANRCQFKRRSSQVQHSQVVFAVEFGTRIANERASLNGTGSFLMI